MSNGDESMSPAEFAKLMGAYPEPAGNPSPAYGGYMDNSAANFAWVNNNDYFGADSQDETLYIKNSSIFDNPERKYDIPLYTKILKEAGATKVWTEPLYGWANQSEVVIFTGLSEHEAEKALKQGVSFLTDKDPTYKMWFPLIHSKDAHWDAESFNADWQTNDKFWEMLHEEHEYLFDEDGMVTIPHKQLAEIAKEMGFEAESFSAESKRPQGMTSTRFRHKETGKIATQIPISEMRKWEKLDADTDLTPTNQMNNSIGQVVPITNPMELPTNLIEAQAGGGPEGQITPDVFSAETNYCYGCGLLARYVPNQSLEEIEVWDREMRRDKKAYSCSDCYDDLVYGAETFEATPKWECDACGDMHDDEDEAESCCVIDCDHSDSEMSSWGGAYRGSEFWMICNNCGAEGYGLFGSIDWSHDDKTLEHVKTAETFEAPYGGTGAIMDIGKDTALDQFTDEELTTSSAIHGDFDKASLDYSGHQNIEVRAESPEEFAERHTYYGKCLSCGDIAVDSVSVLTCLSCGQEHKYMEGRGIVLQAEMDIVADGMAVVSNIRDDVVGVVEVIDDEDDDEMVEISIQDENMEEIGSFTLDDGEIFGDEDDYNSNFGAEKKSNSILPIVLGAVAAIFAYPYLKNGVMNVFGADNDTQEVLENEPELIENPDIGDLDPAQYEELVVESTGYAVDIIPMGLDGSFMGSRFAALPTERYVDYNDPGIGAHTDIALDRDEVYLEPEMAMVQASETEVKETQAPGQSPYFQMGEEPADMNYRVIKETHPVSLDPAVKSFIPQSMTGYTGNKNTPPSVYNKMFNIGVLGQTPLFTPQDAGDIGASRAGSRRATPDVLGLNGSVGGPLSDKVNANYTDGTTSMSLAQWAIENTVSQSSDTEAVVIDRSSGAMKRIRRV